MNTFAIDSESVDRLLSEQAMPIVRRVVASRLGSACPDLEDVCSQVLLDLLQHLRGQRGFATAAVSAFASYAATAAHHGCDHYLRRKHPMRWRLRNRIRYVLEHDRRLTIWKDADGVWWCGRHGSQSLSPGAVPSADRLTVGDERRVADLLLQIFVSSAGPLPLTAVVDLAATIWRVPLVARSDLGTVETLADGDPRADVAIQHRQNAAQVWEQIRALPARQRHALLLNLKHDAIDLLMTTGTASLRAIAESLDMAVETLAALWQQLPLADNDIAARLGCSRQQVINLRMAARKRLANRLAGWS